MGKKKNLASEESKKKSVDVDNEESLDQDAVDAPVDESVDLDDSKSLEPDLQAQLDAANEQIKTLKEAELRAYAELENFKRRKEQEKVDFLKFSTEKLIVDVLPILDAFDMALTQAEQLKGGDTDSLLEGLELIKKQIHTFLEKSHVTKIEAIGQVFDPNLHQAVMKESKEGVDADCIISEMQAGYRLNDRVIRPSMVVISE